MKITLSAANEPPHHLESDLNQLWREVQDKRKRNQHLQNQLDKLVLTYQQKILPVERERLLPAQLKLTERLIELFSRKSLSHWHRDEMSDWIGSLLDRLALLDEEKSVELTNRYNTHVAKISGLSLEELQAYQSEEEQSFDEILNEMFEMEGDGEIDPQSAAEAQATAKHKAQEEAKNSAQTDLFGFDDLDLTGAEPGLDHNQKKTTIDKFEESCFNEEQADNQWLRSLFRRAARTLHPDLEQDPKKREAKQKIMVELLSARDNEDVMTLVSLYAEHVQAGDLRVQQDDIDKLYRLLEQQSMDLEYEYENCIYGSPFTQMVHDKLYARTKQARTKKLQLCLKAINIEASQTNDFTQFLRNLNCLKEVLAERYDLRQVQLQDTMAELMEEAFFSCPT